MGGGPAQANRTSPGHNSTGQSTGSLSTTSSPPLPRFAQTNAPAAVHNAMSTEVFSPMAAPTPSSKTNGNGFSYALSPIGQAPSFENQIPSSLRLGEPDRSNRGMNHVNNGMGGGAAILMRKLPRNTSQESLRSMLLFAKNFVDADFVANDYGDDSNFLTAIARFQTLAAAEEARAMLDGKPNSTNEANMIVDIIPGHSGPSPNRRNTIDNTLARGSLNTPVTAPGPMPRQSSRFNATFQSLDTFPTHNGISSPSGELAALNESSRLHTIFSPQSSIGNTLNEHQRVTGKSVIDQDVDEDTGELLKDPVAYAQNGHAGSVSMPRRSTNPMPIQRFAGLTLSTNVAPQMQTFPSARSAVNNAPTPSSAMSPTGPNMGPNSGFQFSNPNYRHNYPAVNPADQNPPCNTLYVGNLPMDASEDELKNLFSKQRGYKRLCFRTKQNGPMCFVEFEEINFAIKALHELYGFGLSNSVKGGIRLSFSKNPLGVRAGQPGSMNPSTPMTPPGSMSAANGLAGAPGPMFSTANGPPPGLQAPPGLNVSMGMTSGGMPTGNNPLQSPVTNGSGASHNGLGNIGSNGINPMRSMPGMASGPTTPGAGGVNGTPFPDYMMGR